ncbi:MAG: helix-turn-helix domain-containing protein [Legionellales bacterium]|nr:helix-turn-helix domain-containing protein [Legionellales bacterium]
MSGHKLKENIERLMQLHGIKSVMELSRESKTPQPTLHHILSGATQRPRSKSLTGLAAYFSVSVDQLLGRKPLPMMLPDHILQHLTIQMLPIIGWQQAKHWPMPMVRERDDFAKVVVDHSINANAFALQLEHSLHSPLFTEGGILILDPDKQPENHDYVLVYCAKKDSIEVCQLMDKSDTYQVKCCQADEADALVTLEPYQDRILATIVEVHVRLVAPASNQSQ